MKTSITPSLIENTRDNVTLPLESPPERDDLNRKRCKRSSRSTSKKVAHPKADVVEASENYDESKPTDLILLNDADVKEDLLQTFASRDEAENEGEASIESAEELPIAISEKSEQKNMKMETYMNKRIDEYIVGFKNDIKSKMSTLEIINHPNISETEVEKMREFLEYIFEYPKLVLEKKDFNVSRRRTTTQVNPNLENQVIVLPFPAHMQCLAKRSDGIQCTRKKKKSCDFCGTHAKLDAIQRTTTPESIQRMEVSAEDIHGIIYYIDRYNNVYNTEDILEGKENPQIIAKATKHSNNMYMIEEFL
jgi:hypothetical protein